MKTKIQQLREMWQRDEGFTLIEMLIVILVLGILAGIAVFASAPFQSAAEAACVETNAQIAIVADAAVEAGVTGDLYADGPDCSGAGGGPGGGGGDVAPTGTVSVSNSGGTLSANTSGVSGSPSPDFTFSWQRSLDFSGSCTSSGYGTWGGSSSSATQTGTDDFYCYRVVWTASNGVAPDAGDTSSPIRGG